SMAAYYYAARLWFEGRTPAEVCAEARVNPDQLVWISKGGSRQGRHPAPGVPGFPLYALTIRQPWAFAVVADERDGQSPKRVENRGPGALGWRYRGPLLIHAGLGWDERGANDPRVAALLGTGLCFRDQVLEVCPELSRYSQASAGIQKTFEGSSLETIRHMVATGIGITVLPWLAQPPEVLEGRRRDDGLLAYVPFSPPPPTRRVVLAWRRSFTRAAAIEALRDAILRAVLPGVTKLGPPPDA
ncbi:MAG TPA: LysR substrate-binding domain-containing protein, partial [Burkholderiaceae bacterium]|nr:LysR substrate-binding domain-containing protein [Burkholderiaceae bacterium]